MSQPQQRGELGEPLVTYPLRPGLPALPKFLRGLIGHGTTSGPGGLRGGFFPQT